MWRAPPESGHSGRNPRRGRAARRCRRRAQGPREGIRSSRRARSTALGLSAPGPVGQQTVWPEPAGAQSSTSRSAAETADVAAAGFLVTADLHAHPPPAILRAPAGKDPSQPESIVSRHDCPAPTRRRVRSPKWWGHLSRPWPSPPGHEGPPWRHDPACPGCHMPAPHSVDRRSASRLAARAAALTL
jgi:hypothetical protein